MVVVALKDAYSSLVRGGGDLVALTAYASENQGPMATEHSHWGAHGLRHQTTTASRRAFILDEDAPAV